MLELSYVGLPLYGIISEWDYPCVGLSMHGVIWGGGVICACSSSPVPVEELVLSRTGPGL